MEGVTSSMRGLNHLRNMSILFHDHVFWLSSDRQLVIGADRLLGANVLPLICNIYIYICCYLGCPVLDCDIIKPRDQAIERLVIFKNTHQHRKACEYSMQGGALRVLAYV